MRSFLSLLAFAVGTSAVLANPAFEADFQRHLEAGDLAAAEKRARQAADAGDNQGRFAAAVATLLHGVEQGAAEARRHGLRPPEVLQWIGPIPHSPLGAAPTEPRETRYGDVRGWAESSLALIARADADLAAIDGDFKLPLRLFRAGIDLDGDGTLTDDERLAGLLPFEVPDLDGERDAVAPGDLVIAFDRADAEWLRGYCQFLMGTLEFVLAHDFEPFFNHAAHLFFARPVTPFPFMAEEQADYNRIMDAVVSIHLLRFEVVEPERARRSLQHFENVLKQTRLTWKRVAAETDSDREWLPAPNQQAFMPTISVTPEAIAAWDRALGSLEDVLAGRKLMPFWRGAPSETRGVNLRKVFSAPRTFDVLFWHQGTAALPYLEDGQVVEKELWEDMHAVWSGDLFLYALSFDK